MDKALLKFKKMKKNTLQWMNQSNSKIDYFIDKYHLIKVGCVVGTGIKFNIK